MKKLEDAFESLKKKYPDAAKELEKEFRKAIRKVSERLRKQKGEQVSRIRVEGVGRDGCHYVAEFDAVFPKGTQILSVQETKP